MLLISWLKFKVALIVLSLIGDSEDGGDDGSGNLSWHA